MLGRADAAQLEKTCAEMLNPPCSWMTSTAVELTNRAKEKHTLLAADWAVGRSTHMEYDVELECQVEVGDDGRWVMGNTFQAFAWSHASDVAGGGGGGGVTYDDYLTSPSALQTPPRWSVGSGASTCSRQQAGLCRRIKRLVNAEDGTSRRWLFTTGMFTTHLVFVALWTPV